jgi:C-terminal processing protease CtpA/Prc
MRSLCAVTSFALLSGCSALLGPTVDHSYGTQFDLVWTEFDRHYAFFDIKGVVWNDVRTELRERAVAATGDRAFAEVIATMMKTLDDAHVALFTPWLTYGSMAEPPHSYFSAATVMRNYVPSSQMSPSRNIRYGRAENGIGYIWIPSFAGKQWVDEIDLVLENLAGAPGIVIDVRNNGGGNNGNAKRVAEAFVDVERTYAYIRWRNGPQHDAFTGYLPRTISPSRTARFHGPIAVLINQRMYSAAEDFAMMLSVLPGATLVGVRTAGALGNPLVRELPNGWTYQVPQWRQYTAERQLAEHVGVVPDVPVPLTAADSIAGRDLQLEAALEQLRQRIAKSM